MAWLRGGVGAVDGGLGGGSVGIWGLIMQLWRSCIFTETRSGCGIVMLRQRHTERECQEPEASHSPDSRICFLTVAYGPCMKSGPKIFGTLTDRQELECVQ